MLHFSSLLQNQRVAPLHARRHGAADIGKRLVAVQAAQLDVLPVQQEAVRGEARFAEADARGVFVDSRAASSRRAVTWYSLGCSRSQRSTAPRFASVTVCCAA